jgi:hypothetical protein
LSLHGYVNKCAKKRYFWGRFFEQFDTQNRLLKLIFKLLIINILNHVLIVDNLTKKRHFFGAFFIPLHTFKIKHRNYGIRRN